MQNNERIMDHNGACIVRIPSKYQSQVWIHRNSWEHLWLLQTSRIMSFVVMLVLFVSFYEAKLSVSLRPLTRNSNPYWTHFEAYLGRQDQWKASSRRYWHTWCASLRDSSSLVTTLTFPIRGLGWRNARLIFICGCSILSILQRKEKRCNALVFCGCFDICV